MAGTNKIVATQEVDSQRMLKLAAKRETLAGLLCRVEIAPGQHVIKGAPPRLRGPYRTPAGCDNAIMRMLRYADAFELQEDKKGVMALVQTHHTGMRDELGNLKKVKPPRRQAKPGKRAQLVDEATLATDEELSARQDALDLMVAHGVDVAGMKHGQALVEAKAFLFPAIEAGEQPYDVVERWRGQRGPSEEDPEGLAALADLDGGGES